MLKQILVASATLLTVLAAQADRYPIRSGNTCKTDRYIVEIDSGRTNKAELVEVLTLVGQEADVQTVNLITYDSGKVYLTLQDTNRGNGAVALFKQLNAIAGVSANCEPAAAPPMQLIN